MILQVLDAAQVLQQVASAVTDVAGIVERSQAAGPCKISAATAATGLPALRQQLQQLVIQPDSSNVVAKSSVSLLPEDSVGSILSLQFVESGQAARFTQETDCGMDIRCGDVTTKEVMGDLLQPAVHLLLCTRRGMLCYNLSSREAERCWLFGEEAGHLLCILNPAELDSLFKTRLECLIGRIWLTALLEQTNCQLQVMPCV